MKTAKRARAIANRICKKKNTYQKIENEIICEELDYVNGLIENAYSIGLTLCGCDFALHEEVRQILNRKGYSVEWVVGNGTPHTLISWEE